MLSQRFGRRARGLRSRLRTAYAAIHPPGYPGLRLTPRRLLNFYLVKMQRARGHRKLWGYPLRLNIEAANLCNLRCPYCLTGAGEMGRRREHFPAPLYGRLIDELGPYLLAVTLHNWGEPLLNKDIARLVRIATDRGLCTTLSTNFSLPYSAERAEALVASGLSVLTVSLDGVTQDTYERYRVKGNLEQVLDNIRLMRDAKGKLRSEAPQLVWAFHVFEWNKDEVEQAKSMAADLGMDIGVHKGWVAGPEWDPDGPFRFYEDVLQQRCEFLWERAIVNTDGGVAPCCGTFYKEHDFGLLDGKSFKEVWNNEAFQTARGLFRSRHRPGGGESLICHDCPATLNWRDYQRHLAAGLPKASFKSNFTTNDGFNFFFETRPGRAGLAVDVAGPQSGSPGERQT